MKVFLSLLFILSLPLQAVTIQSKIESIDQGQKDSPHLIFLQNGVVVFLEISQQELFNSILTEIKSQRIMEFEVDQNQNLLSIHYSDSLPASEEIHPQTESPVLYKPTIFKDHESAYRMFKDMREDYKEDSGQCYNMAHIWAYEEYLRTKTQSIKLFMFFTNKFIRRYRFPWWFHVSPAVFATSENKISRLILDRRYTTYPMSTKEWTDIFIESGRDCKEVNKMAEYIRTSKSEDCYLIETPMYYWQPRNIRLRDTHGRIKETFSKSEIQHARNEAFEP